jgi:hypothetical protein
VKTKEGEPFNVENYRKLAIRGLTADAFAASFWQNFLP